MAEQHSPDDSPKADDDHENVAESEEIAAEILNEVIGRVVEDTESVSDAAGSSSSAADGSSLSTSDGLGPLGDHRKRGHTSTMTSESTVSTSLGSESAPPTRKRGPPSTWASSSSSVDSVFNRSSSGSIESPEPGKVEDVKLDGGKQMYVTVRITDIFTLEERYIVRGRRRAVWDDGEVYTEASIIEYLREQVETEFRGTRYTVHFMGGSILLHNLNATTVGLYPIHGTQIPTTGEAIEQPEYAVRAFEVVRDWRPDYQVVHLLPDTPPPSAGSPDASPSKK